LDKKQINYYSPAITFTHNGFIWQIWPEYWSPNGNHLATVSDDHTAKIWNSQNGDLLYTLEHDDFVYSVVGRPDGGRVATASDDHTAKICNQFQNLSFEQVLFLALVYHYNHVNNQPLPNAQHLSDIHNSLPADIQKSIKKQSIEKTQNDTFRLYRGWRLGGLAVGAAVAGFRIYKWLRRR
jgi:WD40 repeat protein